MFWTAVTSPPICAIRPSRHCCSPSQQRTAALLIAASPRYYLLAAMVRRPAQASRIPHFEEKVSFPGEISGMDTHCQGLLPPQHPLLAAPPHRSHRLAPASHSSTGPRQPQACQGLQARASLAHSSFHVLRAHARRASERPMYCLDCSDFATLLPPQSFPSPPPPIAAKVL